MKNQQIIQIIDRLAKEYPDAECALTHHDLFQLLVAVTLSAQTTDKSVNRVSPILFDTYPNAEALSQAHPADLETILKPVGMYKTKTRNIINLAIQLRDRFDGQVPRTYEELVTLPGVGRKTANVVLSVGLGEQRIAVDTHVFRLANRIGLVKASDVLKTELALMDCIPKEHWTATHHGLIFHGRNCCTARNPACGRCVIEELCEKNGVDR